jgi:dihydroxy-acid dehydratase
VGGPIALLQNGDVITLDAEHGTLSVNLSDAELQDRRARWQPRQNDFGSGALWKYAQSVGPACDGAVTHGGAAMEKRAYGVTA